MNGYTPGPWKLNKSGQPVIRWGGIGKGEYAVLIPDEPYLSWLADARLIVAAPALLEACKAALPYVDGLHDPGISGTAHIIYPMKIAIAKAEGRKP